MNSRASAEDNDPSPFGEASTHNVFTLERRCN
ncbi:hypothetical protein HNP40_000701 [Mycobacteroides chelonae]|nr:hypothetical protein [Mycobacteroides chelonae]